MLYRGHTLGECPIDKTSPLNRLEYSGGPQGAKSIVARFQGPFVGAFLGVRYNQNSNHEPNGPTREKAAGLLTSSNRETYREQDSNLHVLGTPDPKSFPDDPCAVRVYIDRI